MWSAVDLPHDPDTMVWIKATRDGRSEVHDWHVSDGEMTGAPSGVGSGPEQYEQLRAVQIIYWLTSPKRQSHRLADR